MLKFRWENRNVFITGSSGFVGGWLVDRLAKDGANVVALTRLNSAKKIFSLQNNSNIRVVEGEVQDTLAIHKILNNFKIDTVFHLAANNTNIGTNEPPISIFETNIKGVWSVLEACRTTDSVERVVVASSMEAEIEVGDNKNNKYHPYKVSKISAELVAKAYSDTYDMPVAISRTGNLYGGGDTNWNRLIPSVVKSILSGYVPKLRSDGRLMRDYMYIDDMISAYKVLAENANTSEIKGKVVNFGTGITYSAIDIVKIICEITDKSDIAPIIMNSSKNERVNKNIMHEYALDILNWQSKVALIDGLTMTVSWYKKYFREKSSK